MLDDMYVTMSISTGLYPNLDLWTANKLQLQLQLHIFEILKCLQTVIMCNLVFKFKEFSCIKYNSSLNCDKTEIVYYLRRQHT